MSWQIALRAPLSEDLRPFLAVLQQAQVPHRVAEENAEQVLWVPDFVVEQVATWYREGVRLAPEQQVVLPVVYREPWLRQIRQAPVTSLVLLLSCVVALMTWMGAELSTVRWFNLQDFQVQGDYAYFVPLSESLAQGQWWRLFSPMLMHFWIPGMGPLHLVMNGLWYWVLGRRLEQQQGSWALLLLTLLFSVASSLAQYVESGPGIAGGLSGVLYGLLGYCWIFNKLVPRSGLQLPSGVVWMMLGWLLLCWVGAFSFVASVANGAHIGGLLAGCLLGLILGGFARRQRSLS